MQKNSTKKTARNLLQEVLDTFKMTVGEFEEFAGIKKSTLNTWKNHKISPVGELYLKTLIENKKLKDKVSIIETLFETFNKK